MEQSALKVRTKVFALKIIKLVNTLPANQTGSVIGRQLLRSGTSVAANYRSACRARSSADFAAKMGIVEEEADESLFWLEMLVDCGMLPKAQLGDLMDDADAILAMTVASIKTVKRTKRAAAIKADAACRTPHAAREGKT